MYMYSITYPLTQITSPAIILNSPINSFCPLDLALVLVTQKYELFLFRRAMTKFFLSVHFIVTAQTTLECFGAFIVYMPTVNNVKITFGCVQFVDHKSCIYTCINIYGRTRYIKNKEEKTPFGRGLEATTDR